MAHGRAASPRHCGPSPQTQAHGWHGPCPGQRRLSFSASCRGLGSHRRGYQTRSCSRASPIYAQRLQAQLEG
eukprot:6235947-Pyramimonas_sp.AAC.1